MGGLIGLAGMPAGATENDLEGVLEARIDLFDDRLDFSRRRAAKKLEPARKKKSRDSVEYQLEGNIEAELRAFTDDVDMRESDSFNASLSIDPIFEIFWNRGDHSLTINPFFRADMNDDERTHFDIRQLKWIGVFGDWEVRVGVDRVFWGVTESAHLVDVINQDDLLEDIDGEDKLGQPLVSVSYQSKLGTFTGYVMPYFRERHFPGLDGRPAIPLEVDRSQTIFAADDNNWHTDWAVRYTHIFGPVDFGASYFNGLSRDPNLLPGLNDDGGLVLVPFYNEIEQVGVDLQITLDSWLIKFEGITVDPRGEDRYWSYAAGVEYTFYQAFGSVADIGVLMEYLWDSRGALGPSAFEDDFFVGLRWEGNDQQTTRILGGMVFDLDSSSKSLFLEASRRLGDRWRITLDARFFLDVAPGDPLFFFRTEDFIQLRLARFF